MKIIFLDTETNGLDADRYQVLEIAFQIRDLKTGFKLVEYSSVIKINSKHFLGSSRGALDVNGFTWEEIEKNGKDIWIVKEEIKTIFQTYKISYKDSIFLCQNPSFDRPFFNQIIPVYEQRRLKFPYHWLDLASMFWVKQKKENKSLFLSKDNIANFYGLLPEKQPHRAKQGVEHLVLCFNEVIKTKSTKGNKKNKSWISVFFNFLYYYIVFSVSTSLSKWFWG